VSIHGRFVRATGWATMVVLTFIVAPLALAAETAGSGHVLEWFSLPPLPGLPGVAGPFVGSHAGALIVAGGANFPVPPGGDRWAVAKTWHDETWVLTGTPEAAKWRPGPPLPRRVGYGMAASTPRGVVCAGGEDGENVFADCFLLAWDPPTQRLEARPLPGLPRPTAFGGSAAIGSAVYVACGQSGLTLDTAGASFARIDLNVPEGTAPVWETLPDVPGGPRAHPVVVAQHDGFDMCVYVMSGRRTAGDAGAIEPLTDVWEFSPARAARDITSAWKRRSDLPRPMMAGTAAAVGQSHLFVLAGDDGGLWERVDELRDHHPGFRRESLAYHTITDTWVTAGATPANQVTTTAVPWADGLALVSGEIRPRQRTTDAWLIRLPRSNHGFGPWNMAVLVAYLLGTLALGAWFATRTHSTDDFFRGGQRVPWWVAGLSIYATTLSSITYMALPAKAFAQDWALALGNLMIVAVAPLAVYVAMPFFRTIDATSAYEYLERRFGRSLRLFGSGSFTLFHIFRMAIVMSLAALALSAITPLTPRQSVVVMGLLSVAYCTLGGLEAVVWTDAVQTLVLLGGAVACLAVMALGLPGSVGEALQAAWDADKLRLATLGWDPTATQLGLFVVLLGAFAQHVTTYTSDQAVVQRYMTTPDTRRAARAIWTNAALAMPGTILFFTIGTGLWLFYRAHPGRLDPSFHTDQTLPLFISREMPVGLAGLVVAGIFAAAQSTISTSMNSTATTVVTDFLRPMGLLRGEHNALWAARAATACIGCGGTALGTLFVDPGIRSLWDQALAIIGLLLGSLGGLFCLGMFSRRANRTGAIAGVAVSVATLAAVSRLTAIQGYFYAAIGIAACFAVGWGISLLGPPPPARCVDGLTVWSTRRPSGRGGENAAFFDR